MTTAVPPVGDAQLGAAISTAIMIALPAVTLDPSAPAIVQLPTILSTQAQAAFAQSGTSFGVAWTAQVTPAWEWAFGDDDPSPTLDATTSGTAYDGVDPVDHPEHYLLHTWRTRGTKTVTLSVTWTTTVTRHDSNETFTLPGATVRMATTSVDVREGRAELTSGG